MVTKSSKLKLSLSGYSYPHKEDDVLRAIELEVPEGAFWSIVGPSGCGKTTILRLLAGLIPLKSGVAEIDGVPYNSTVAVDTPSEIGMLFQECERSLLPWLTVRENVSWAIRRNRRCSERADGILTEVLQETELTDYCDSFPHELSGGLKRRLGLARILAHRPEILLLDEPCVSLDIFARRKMEGVLRRVWKKHGFTVVLVTHEIEEAICLGQRVIFVTKPPCGIHKEIAVEVGDLEYTSAEFEEIRRKVLETLEEVTE